MSVGSDLARTNTPSGSAAYCSAYMADTKCKYWANDVTNIRKYRRDCSWTVTLAGNIERLAATGEYRHSEFWYEELKGRTA